MLRVRHEITKSTIELPSCTELNLVPIGLVPNSSCTEVAYMYRNWHFMYQSGMFRNSLVPNWS